MYFFIQKKRKILWRIWNLCRLLQINWQYSLKYVLCSLKVPAGSPIWHGLFLVIYTLNSHLLVLYMFSRPDSFKNQVMFRCLQYHCCYKYFIYSYQNIVFNAWLLYNTSLNLKRSAFVMKNLSYLKTSLPETDMIINDNRIIFQTDKWKADLIYVKEVSDVHLTR